MSIPQTLITQAIAWRRAFHAAPELGFEEHTTAQRIASLLLSFGLEVNREFAVTAVVGTLRNGPGPVIGLRADMDALPIQELGQCEYRSVYPGRMHACGHDGHSAILLAAAAHLSATRQFSGTVHFIFQPAEENLAGGQKMVEDGLFEHFPMDAIYALHNWPGLPEGHIVVNAGPMMASQDTFEITLTGKSCHAAMPESGADPIIAAAQLIMGLQTISSRRVSPKDAIVISVTQLNAGEVINSIPETATLRGTVRCLSPQVRTTAISIMEDMVRQIPAGFGVAGRLSYRSGYPVTLNDPQAAAAAYRAAIEVVGPARATFGAEPSMAAEDFAFMLQVCPGAYLWLGAGDDAGTVGLHHPHYDFNDAIIETGVNLWTRLIEQSCPLHGTPAQLNMTQGIS
ncbi:M20 aminoacylase family protein [Acerihabitans sp. TG2]|uniref:M20 aminoacylase family protein n=1 Tax=Acerihabitans sp. TG2 TaxID=3096008 RepID=UPI002B2352E5|nr:M20 aminoacylase family protein [Acerihabitans sp. TG2]MEA9390086.1 M20 aminoacylase family protein [Acerihabitans sp. TG2]